MESTALGAGRNIASNNSRLSRRAPPHRAGRRPPTVNVMVFGDSLSDWLAYGLEEAFAETPEIGIVRKPRANSGLIRVETRGESYDWPAAARDMMNAEKPDFVVMMLGVADRRGIRETIRQQPARSPAGQKQDQAKQAQPRPRSRKLLRLPRPSRRSRRDSEAPPQQDAAQDREHPSVAAPEGPDRRNGGA